MKKIKTKKTKVRKVREPKVREPKVPGAKTCKVISKFKKASAKATLIVGVALFFATIIGGLVVDVPTTTMVTWVYGALIGIFGFFFALSFILFLIWYMPRPAFSLLISGLLVTVALLLFVYPDGMFNLNLNGSLQGLFNDLKQNEIVQNVLGIIDGIFSAK